ERMVQECRHRVPDDRDSIQHCILFRQNGAEAGAPARCDDQGDTKAHDVIRLRKRQATVTRRPAPELHSLCSERRSARLTPRSGRIKCPTNRQNAWCRFNMQTSKWSERHTIPDQAASPPAGEQMPRGIDSGAILNALPDAVLLLDERGRILYANAAAEQLFQASLAQLAGHTI